ncbi:MULTISPECIES: hypothetical protein [unclassified Leucobacter]|uniref:hypothetical protein n=1 Tax=unclassified Leucobacter TaxID=2621730 RepID=UPI00062219C9|nr:hypothetical protein [Leucobacter sp. Ag1]KKI22488.1 hypothetical protein XM48_01480 [Leucobacter sp. Ag1]
MADRIYYEDQSSWAPPDYYALWRYFDRLAEYVGPTPAQAQQPEHRSARISAKKTGVRDEEFTAIDPARMPTESQWLLRAVLISQQRYELALEKLPNLGALVQAVASTVPNGTSPVLGVRPVRARPRRGSGRSRPPCRAVP